MAATSNELASQLVQSLQPYVKTRHEAQEIRRAITAFLASQINSPAGFKSAHLSLCVPHQEADCKDVSEGRNEHIYSEYLSALQDNANANREYHELLDKHRSEEGPFESPRECDDIAQHVQAYTSHMRARREKARFTSYRKHLNQLTQTEGSQYGYISLSDEQARISQLSQDLTSRFGKDGNALENKGDEVEESIHNLEKTVIQARVDLQRESDRLKKVKAWVSRASESEMATEGDRVLALSLTRDELVHWVEDALSMSANDGGDSSIETPSEDDHDNAVLGEDGRNDIMDQYDAYLKSRAALLSTITEFLRPLPQKQHRIRRQNPHQKQESQASTSYEVPPLVSYVTQNLIPLDKACSASDAQSKHLSSKINKESNKILHVLDRLQEESQLLHEFSTAEDSQQWQQQHRRASSAPVFNTSFSKSSGPHQTPAAEVAKRAEAWTAAANKARNATNTAVAEQLDAGAKLLEHADTTLRGMYRLINQNMDQLEGKNRDSGGQLHESSTQVELGRRAAGPWYRFRESESL